MRVTTKMESDKTELALDVNSFDKPKEYNSVQAWSQLMTNLIFMRKGTYPSLPDMGVDIAKYEFEFLDNACEQLSAEIAAQQQTYLPDVPLTGVMVTPSDFKGQPIMLVQLQFQISNTDTAISAIAINTSKRNFLDFEVSW